MKITHRKVLMRAGYSDTWLAPWVGFVFKIHEYKSGLKLVDGDKNQKINGYLKYLSKPLKTVIK